MPTYEYQCSECKARTEAFQKMSDEPLTTCPKCQKEALRRIVSGGAGVLYKGEGWYVTDYSKKSSGGKEVTSTTDPAAPSSENRSEGKSSDQASPKASDAKPSEAKSPAPTKAPTTPPAKTGS